mmetsp:Transcript_95267/g.269144  ORF Transcript_95267/g.269144 Transcript_95267/m.269144 type:complete len:217 (+) Transcript_95267:68-718(+)
MAVIVAYFVWIRPSKKLTRSPTVCFLDTPVSSALSQPELSEDVSSPSLHGGSWVRASDASSSPASGCGPLATSCGAPSARLGHTASCTCGSTACSASSGTCLGPSAHCVASGGALEELPLDGNRVRRSVTSVSTPRTRHGRGILGIATPRKRTGSPSPTATLAAPPRTCRWSVWPQTRRSPTAGQPLRRPQPSLWVGPSRGAGSRSTGESRVLHLF